MVAQYYAREREVGLPDKLGKSQTDHKLQV